MKTATMKIADIHPAEYNPRKELQPGDKEYEALKNSLDRFGLATPLIVNEKTGTLVGGHQRLNVLKASGETETEVVLIDMDEDREKLLNIALNRIDGDWDYLKLEALFDEIPEEDIAYTGFTPEELDNLFNTTPIDEAEEEGGGAEPEPEEKPADEEFTVFLSFAKKEEAEEWLMERGVDVEFPGEARNLIVRMEGSEYGTGD